MILTLCIGILVIIYMKEKIINDKYHKQDTNGKACDTCRCMKSF